MDCNRYQEKTDSGKENKLRPITPSPRSQEEMDCRGFLKFLLRNANQLCGHHIRDFLPEKYSELSLKKRNAN